MDAVTIDDGIDQAGMAFAPQVESRASPRVRTVLRVARVETDTDQGLARVQNISDSGAGLRSEMAVMLGDAMALEFNDGVTVRGRVVWSSGSDYGLRFDEPLDSGALLARLAVQGMAGKARPLRLKVHASVRTQGSNGKFTVQLLDISQQGMKIRHDGSFSEGLLVKIVMPSGKERRGVVRWSIDEIAGVMLLEPFSVGELGSANAL